MELTRTADLPLAWYGVRTLDVGTGPAPVLYAVMDFYHSLREFADAREVGALKLPAPELSVVEGSHAMTWFVHHFSEFTGRSIPFDADWRHFAAFDPAGRRTGRLKTRVAQIAEEDDTSEGFARRWIDQNEGWLHGAERYRLCFFSNFLTTFELVDRLQDGVNAAFGAVTPGGVVVITGSDSVEYIPIYRAVAQTAKAVGFRPLETRQRFDPPDPDPCATQIKRLYTAVWNRLEELGAARPDLLPRARDLWDPRTPYRNTSFALRAYRRDGTSG